MPAYATTPSLRHAPASRALRIAALALLTLAALCAGPHDARAQATPEPTAYGGWLPELTLLCGDGSDEPRFQNRRTGRTAPILDPQLRAVAEKACKPGQLEGATGNYPVTIVNNRSVTVYVGYTLWTLATPPITWGSGCTPSGTGAAVAPGASCNVKVGVDNTSSRFCAALDAVPANCFNAQANNQTMIETIFQPASNGGCFNKGNCVWFDISLIPTNCTDAAWDLNQCTGTGRASYNLPVQLSCNNVPVYSCQGPVNTTYGPENYPSKCGNPAATCVGGKSTCQNAYFYPMFDPPENAHQPNSPCLGGKVFTINFLAGP